VLVVVVVVGSRFDDTSSPSPESREPRADSRDPRESPPRQIKPNVVVGRG
jgi:hypothetical protein